MINITKSFNLHSLAPRALKIREVDAASKDPIEIDGFVFKKIELLDDDATLLSNEYPYYIYKEELPNEPNQVHYYTLHQYYHKIKGMVVIFAQSPEEIKEPCAYQSVTEEVECGSIIGCYNRIPHTKENDGKFKLVSKKDENGLYFCTTGFFHPHMSSAIPLILKCYIENDDITFIEEYMNDLDEEKWMLGFDNIKSIDKLKVIFAFERRSK